MLDAFELVLGDDDAVVDCAGCAMECTFVLPGDEYVVLVQLFFHFLGDQQVVGGFELSAGGFFDCFLVSF